MRYTKREKLTVVKLQENADCIDFDTLAGMIRKSPSTMIYFELGKKLYGIVSMGDIVRERKDGKNSGSISIHKQFTSVLEHEYMRARRIFQERENINAIPVIDKNNVLLGEYSRWYDSDTIESIFSIGGGKLLHRVFAKLSDCSRNAFSRKKERAIIALVPKMFAIALYQNEMYSIYTGAEVC